MAHKPEKARKKDVAYAAAKALGSEEIQCGRLRLFPSLRRITKDGKDLHLSPIQFHLLSIFMHHPGEVLPRSFLMREVWHTEYMGDTRLLYVHIHLLREKIEDDPHSPVLLRTVRGVGYRFTPPTNDQAPPKG